LSNGSNLSSKALADGLDDGVVLNVVRVVGLQLGGNAGEGTLESLLGRSVDHLGLEKRMMVSQPVERSQNLIGRRAS
jgi:hypothetical protein